MRILVEAAGNPLALIELSRGVSPDRLGGVEVLSEPLPVGNLLEARFLRQVRALPTDTQRLLLLATAEPTGDPALLWRAGRLLGIDETAILPAEAEDLVSLGPPIKFRHSLIRSAIYQGATSSQRRQAHEALAAATDVDHDPVRRAWHRAAATATPDEDVADELESAADHARSHGSYAVAAALLARSARLTPDPARRAARYLGAADGATKAGDPVEAREDLTLAMPALADPVLVVQARQLDAAIRFDGSMHNWGGNPSTTGRVEDSPALMIDAALAMNRFDTGKAREAALDALLIAIYFGEAATMDVRDIARAAAGARTPALDGSDLGRSRARRARPTVRRRIPISRPDPSRWRFGHAKRPYRA